MTKLAITIAAALAALALPQAAGAEVRVDGRGFGHGIGLSQYGAYGYALKEGRSHRWILGHYYPGTALRRVRARTVRVLLKESSSQKVCGASLAIAGDGRRVRLRDTRMYRVNPSSGGRLQLFDTSARRTKARLANPVRVSGRSTVCLRGLAQNGVRNGRYRGQLALVRGTEGVAAINRVNLEQYLYGVVPAEMPTAWPIEAVKAQAVAARSYALRSLKPDKTFDMFADVRSQVYRGVIAETARGTAAISRTSGRALMYGSEIARTFFFSTSGGRTAAIDEEWGGPPVPYLRSVEDKYDSISPVHMWTVRLSDADAERKLGSKVKGKLEAILVAERNSSGRARTVEIRGSDGITTAAGAQIRTLLGLRSTWFSIGQF